MAGWNGNNNGGGKKGGGMMMILLIVGLCCCLACCGSSALAAFNEDVRSMLGFGSTDPPPEAPADESTTTTGGGDGWVCPYPWTGYKHKQDINGVARCCKSKDNSNDCHKDHRPLQITGDQFTADLIMNDRLKKFEGKLYTNSKTDTVIWREACPCPVGNTTETLNWVQKDGNAPGNMYCIDMNTGGEFAKCNPKCTKGKDANGKDQYVTNAKPTSLTQCGDYDLVWRRW